MQERQIDRLLKRAGRNNELTYCPCVMDDGEDFSFYIKPLTAMQLRDSQKGAKPGVELTQLEAAVKLLTIRALDENGQRQYQADAFNFLMRLPFDDLIKLTTAMGFGGEEEDGGVLDIKSSEEGTEKGKSASS